MKAIFYSFLAIIPWFMSVAHCQDLATWIAIQSLANSDDCSGFVTDAEASKKPDVFKRPFKRCSSPRQYQDCGQPGYQSAAPFEQFCWKPDIQLVPRESYGREFRKTFGNCYGDEEPQSFGIRGISVVHCWKNCREGYYPLKKPLGPGTYWTCGKDCAKTLSKNSILKSQTEDYCAYTKKA